MSNINAPAALLRDLGDAFRFLETDHGMRRTNKESTSYFVVAWKGMGVAVEVVLDYREWVLGVAILVDQGPDQLPASLELNYILRIAGRDDLTTTQDHVIAAAEGGRLPELFAKLADDLKQYGGEALMGDPGIVAAIKDRFYHGVPGDPRFSWWLPLGLDPADNPWTAGPPRAESGTALRSFSSRGVGMIDGVDTFVHFDTMPDNSGSSIEIMTSLPQAPGEVHLAVDGRTGIGHVVAILIGPGHLRLSIDASLAEAVGCATELDIRFPPEHMSEIEAMVSRMR